MIISQLPAAAHARWAPKTHVMTGCEKCVLARSQDGDSRLPKCHDVPHAVCRDRQIHSFAEACDHLARHFGLDKAALG